MKQGVSHLEMVLAFSIFIIAVGGSIFFLQFYRANVEVFAGSDLWVEKLLVSAEDSVMITPFLLNESAIGTGVLIALPLRLPSVPGAVLNQSGTPLASAYQRDLLFFNPQGTGAQFRVVQSSSLSASLPPEDTISLNSSLFTEGATTTREMMTIAHLRELQERLVRDSSATLTELGLPSTLSVSLSFSAPSLSLPALVIPPTDREVRTSTQRVEVLTEEGSFIFGTVQITLW